VSSSLVAIVGFVVLFVLMLLRVPVGMAMGSSVSAALPISSAASRRSKLSATPRCAR